MRTTFETIKRSIATLTLVLELLVFALAMLNTITEHRRR